MDIIDLDKDIIYEPCERETHITTTDDTEDDMWTVYTRQSKVISRLQEIGVMTKCIRYEGKIREAEFKLKPSQIIFSKVRNISEEEKARRSERMKENREKRGK